MWDFVILFIISMLAMVTKSINKYVNLLQRLNLCKVFVSPVATAVSRRWTAAGATLARVRVSGGRSRRCLVRWSLLTGPEKVVYFEIWVLRELGVRCVAAVPRSLVCCAASGRRRAVCAFFRTAPVGPVAAHRPLPASGDRPSELNN